MKKFIFTIICFFCFIFIVKGEELVSENLPYYIKTSSKLIDIKKVYDKDSLEVVFNINPNNYEVNSEFNKYAEFDKEIWKYSENSKKLFNTIVYYSYLNDPSDLNYYYTQVMIWYYIYGLRFTFVNEEGIEITDLKYDYNKLVEKVMLHISRLSFFDTTYNTEIWNTSTFSYNYNSLILDDPIIEELDIKTNNKIISIYNKEVGNYKLEFSKDYEQETYCYSDNTNVYWQSLKGPQDISYTLNYNVYGTKLYVKENLIGVNNKIGDAFLNSTYELYLDNELKLTTDNLDNIYVKSNSNYVLKDISNNNSTYNIDNLNFSVEDSEYILKIDKQVINKNISITINNDKEYYIYLKSNNELYEIVDKNTNLIILPYGEYYVKNNDNYYLEFKVLDDIDEELEIIDDEIIVEDDILREIPNVEENVTEELPSSEDKEDVVEDIIIEEIENPQTGDYIYLHIFNLFITIYCILILKFILSNVF